MMKQPTNSKMLVCVACPKGSDAEILHPILRTPICGSCFAALNDADQAIVNENKVSCTWCGLGDGCELFMCDTCPNSFCTDCIERNFGLQEAELVRAAEVWICYCCSPTAKIKALQIEGEFTFFNIDKAYASVRPPDSSNFDQFNSELAEALSFEEKNYAALFCNGLVNSSIQDLNIAADYLPATDALKAMYQVSSCLRKFFKSKVFLLPGLFQTPYGKENMCKLHYHQLVGLNYMSNIEHRTNEFGALRGGIFGDEPGLGKTVTCLALISATAGTNPQQPDAFWNKEEIEWHWASLNGQYTSMLLPVLNRVIKVGSVSVGRSLDRDFDILKKNMVEYASTLSNFESKVKAAIRECVKGDRLTVSKMLEKFRIEMNGIKEGIDKSNRKINSNINMDRIRHERSLIPSVGTLIIVPETLLEHWYEQIKRHLNLEYFSYNDDCRGVVYMDGLGDIVDIVPPISKLISKQRESNTNVDQLSHFLIVVTTFERCANDFKNYRQTSGTAMSGAGVNADKTQSYSLYANPLLGIRWLRLVVDEGHEIGSLKKRTESKASLAMQLLGSIEDSTSSPVSTFISGIAAERRWIMSGTPTTGANSELGLLQLFRLLTFLRHPLTLTIPQDNSAEGGRKKTNETFIKRELVSTDSLQSAALSIVSGTTDNDSNGINNSQSSTAIVKKPKEYKFTSCSDYWVRKIIIPCLSQEAEAWESLSSLLKELMVRHTKDDLMLFDPISSTVNLDQMPLPSDGQEHVLAVDRAKANYIATTMWKAISNWKQHTKNGTSRRITKSFAGGNGGTRSSFASHRTLTAASINSTVDGIPGSPIGKKKKQVLTLEEQDIAASRKPKAIVFSQNHHDLQGVGHMLYGMMGDSFICEHFGKYRSSELSRFRHSKRKYRTCPLCGYNNPIDNDRFCGKDLIVVEYLDVEPLPEGQIAPPPERGGHGAAGPGGHYTGKCYCSPAGCQTDEEKETCCRFPNAFNSQWNIPDPNYAIISFEHIEGWQPGEAVTVNQIIHVRATDPIYGPTAPLIWAGGVMGGRAIVRYWRPCGGKDTASSWHGSRILQNIPWCVEDQTACILLLQEDGSTGLDLSFATHIFLLERVKDPALRRQIVSRAHRMGATGPVQVQLIQVKSERD